MVTTICGVRIPEKWKIARALNHIQGIGPSSAYKICKACGINPNSFFKELSIEEGKKMEQKIHQNFLVEEKFRKKLRKDLYQIMGLKNYRSTRHRAGLPVRGQRTHTNTKTQKSLSKLRLKTIEDVQKNK